MPQDRRNWNGNDSGILRKKVENNADLLVFGYSCKLFRDDEKALDIDQGKHLIPWMGDDTLKIDRYDVRGALSDLSKFDGCNGGISWNSLTNEERKVERMCDTERYRALFHNEDEEALYQEEELKRLRQALSNVKEYSEVAYQYEEEQLDDSSLGEEGNTADEQQEPFIPPPQLDVPPNMIIPETKKQNAIIEKTASFINEQGPQMEILLKMKQASNPQFQFLSISCPLHAYYRHLLIIMKTGRYKTSLFDDDQNDDDDNDHYLHPSLLSARSTIELAPLIPSIAYKPSADCAYSMLVSKIKSKQEQITPHSSCGADEIGVPAKKQLKDTDSMDTDTSGVKLISKSTKRKFRKKHFSDIRCNGDTSPNHASNYKQANLSKHLGSSDGQSESPVEKPPDELKLIIDKMAHYVVKNGRNFEAIVRAKGDPRFFFLNLDNKYHPYYEQSVRYYETQKMPNSVTTSLGLRSLVLSTESMSEDDIEDHLETKPSSNKTIIISHETNSSEFTAEDSTSFSTPNSSPSRKNNISKIIAAKSKALKSRIFSDSENHSHNKPLPVCFSIKKPKEADKLELSSALPMEESSGDEDDEYKAESDKSTARKAEEKRSRSMDKWAEERVKDKLAQAAKEKLAIREKEKQLQYERKKRAQAFINSIQKDGSQLGKSVDLSKVSRRPSANPFPSDDSVDGEATQSSAQDKAQASQTLQRILDAVPKEQHGLGNNHGRKSYQRSSYNYNYSRFNREPSSKHYRHKSHKRHHTPYRTSHKHSHQSKSSRSHKRRRASSSSESSND